MTEWMKLYAVYSLSISPNYSHRTTLLNTKVLNLYITQVGVSKLGSTKIDFIEPGVKVNGAYYRDNLLAQKLLHTRPIPAIPRRVFCFPTGRHPGASSTRPRRFPGAEIARLHSSNTVATEFTRSEPS